MPNYVSVNIKVNGNKKLIDKFFVNCFTGNNFDFDKIVPEPRTIEECSPEYRANKDSHIVLDDERPWFDWYAWHNRFWGTKWNAMDTNIDRNNNSVSFDTAWNFPYPVMVKMTEMFPDLTFTIEWIEEQGVISLGRVEVKNDEILSENIPEPESKEAYRLMFEFWDNRSDYIFDISEDNYLYITEELSDEYGKFTIKWKKNHYAADFAGQEPPSIEEWYNNDR